MTEKNKLKTYLYNFASIIVLVPCAGRISVAIILYLGIIFVSVFGTLLDFVFKKFASNYSKSIWQLVVLVLLSAIYQQIVMLYSPLMEIYTGFSIYLIAISAFILNSINSESQDSLVSSLKSNSIRVLLFCVFTLVLFVIRDYVGYGTLTVPFCTSLVELELPRPAMMSTTFFWGSIPFTIILLALMLALVNFIIRIWTISKRRIKK